MKRKTVATALLLVALSCARAFPDWYDHQDRTIKMPHFGLTKIDAVIDGPMAQALRVVEEDFLPPPSKRHGCIDSPAVLVYEVIRRGDIIFAKLPRSRARYGRGSSL